MLFDLKEFSPSQVYHLMTQTVIPRPIAWILSENETKASSSNDRYNLAPFSYFNAVCSQPPLLMISVGKKPEGDTKDTARNLTLGAKCVVHIAQEAQAAAVTQSAATLAYGESELNSLELSLCEQENFALPKLHECPIAFNCEVYELKSIGDAEQQLIFLKILSINVDESVLEMDDKGRTTVSANMAQPLARLGANQYSGISNILDLKRPK